MNAKRAFGIGQGALGTILVAFPKTVSVRTAGRESPPPTWLVRVLGARLLGQGCWLTLHPSNEVLAWGTVIDAVHGSTMLVAAFAERTHRRSALSAAGVAAASIAISTAISR